VLGEPVVVDPVVERAILLGGFSIIAVIKYDHQSSRQFQLRGESSGGNPWHIQQSAPLLLTGTACGR
jgi:hypothetical protein